jgi:uncharacterized protein
MTLMTTKAASQQRAGFSYIWLYLGALAGAELLAAGLNISLSLWLHAGLLCFFLLRSYVTEGRESSFHVALAVLPLLRVLSLTIPLWLASPINQLLLVNLPLIAAIFISAWAAGYGRKDLLLSLGYLPVQLIIASSGLLLGYAGSLIIQPPVLAESLELQQILWPVLSLLIFTGFSEELLFRGLLLTATVRLIGSRQGIIYGGVIHGIFHLGWQSWLFVGFMILVSLVFGWLAYRTRSILGVTLAHGLANVLLFIVLPLSGEVLP